MSVKLNQNQYFQASRKKKWCGKNEEIQENNDQVGSYFLASRNMHLIPVRSLGSSINHVVIFWVFLTLLPLRGHLDKA